MYRIMVVDDEYYIRDGLCNVVDWASIGAQVVGEAASGVEALAKVPLVQPAVVITDIRMEDMDGLEFAEAVRDAYPDTRIIFLSGYDNFAYAQKAVELKAYGYILKPGDPEKVLSIVRDALTEIEGERERVNRLTYLEGRESEGLEARRARLLGRVLSSVYSDGEALEEECAKLEIQTHAMHYCVAVLQPDRFYDLELPEDSRHLYALLAQNRSCAERILHSWELHYYESRPCGLVVLLGTAQPNIHAAYCALKEELYQLQARLHAEPGGTYTVGLSDPVEQLAQVGRARQQAEEYLEYKIVLGPGRIITAENLPVPARYIYPKAAEEKILAGIKARDKAVVRAGADAFANELMQRNYGKTQIKAALAELYAVVNRHFNPAEIDLYQIFGKKWMDPHYVVESYNSIEELRNWLRTLLCEVVNILRSHGQVNSKKVVLQVQEFIRANYANAELSLSMIAEHIFLNPTYLSRLYKKETGSNYVEYLTQYRMQEAKRLLSDSTLRINDVSAMVGYSNPQYFCTLFKKCFHVSPMEYREKSASI